jgi:SagB-type dehydrogenase family enzyme
MKKAVVKKCVLVLAIIIIISFKMACAGNQDDLQRLEDIYIEADYPAQTEGYIEVSYPDITDEYIIEANNTALTDGTPLTYILPEPVLDGVMSVEEALYNRRSRRDFEDRALTIEQLSQILWATYGVSDNRGFRTAPSAGAMFPLEIFVVVGNVEGIEVGVYRYNPHEHKIVRTTDSDVREELAQAALGQRMIQEAPIIIVHTAIMSRTTIRYGEEQGRRYVYMEVGHSAQNVYLQVEALGLGTCAVGAFIDTYISGAGGVPCIRELLGISQGEEEPLYLMPIGHVNLH